MGGPCCSDVSSPKILETSCAPPPDARSNSRASEAKTLQDILQRLVTALSRWFFLFALPRILEQQLEFASLYNNVFQAEKRFSRIGPFPGGA